MLGQRDAIGRDRAHAHAPLRRYWAVVGNGPNRIAAHEVRIKLSELCYKSIACDGTEDKKHIDLSSEPLILVCAAGLSGSNADDVAKELAIYRAHKAAADRDRQRGRRRFGAALETIEVPRGAPRRSASCSRAMAGHLFGYEAALAIDASARPLREARAAIEARSRRSPTATSTCSTASDAAARGAGRRSSSTGCGGGSTTAARGRHRGAARVAAPLRDRRSCRSTSYQVEYGKVGHARPSSSRISPPR